jgi:hypothetical protein
VNRSAAHAGTRNRKRMGHLSLRDWWGDPLRSVEGHIALAGFLFRR